MQERERKVEIYHEKAQRVSVDDTGVFLFLFLDV